jgi:hypothetical protein
MFLDGMCSHPYSRGLPEFAGAQSEKGERDMTSTPEPTPPPVAHDVMPGGFPGAQIDRWKLSFSPQDLPMIVLVVRDGGDPALAALLASAAGEPSRRFSAEWGTGQRDGRWLLGLRLFNPGDRFERLLITDDVRRELLEAILDVPHHVALVAEPMVGAPGPAGTGDRPLGRSLVVEVRQRSTHVANLLAPRGTN